MNWSRECRLSRQMPGLAIRIHTIVLGIFLTLGGEAFGETDETGDSSVSDREVSYNFEGRRKYRTGRFSRQYLSLGVGRNYPHGKSANRFYAGFAQPTLTYKYYLDSHWVLGIGLGVKSVKKKHDQKPVAIITVSYQSAYLMRLYDPLYFHFGGKLLYLYPAKAPIFPIQRDADYDIEIGVALTAGFTIALGDRFAIAIALDHWRGTATRRFRATETLITLDYAI